MGATNKTPNLELPQFIGTDKPSWLGDFNGAMTAIDTGYGKQSGDISAAASAAQTAKTTADAAQEASAANTTSIQQLTSEMSDVMADISGLEADVVNINTVTIPNAMPKVSLVASHAFDGAFSATGPAVVVEMQNTVFLIMSKLYVLRSGPNTASYFSYMALDGNPLKLIPRTITTNQAQTIQCKSLGTLQGYNNTQKTAVSSDLFAVYASNTNLTYLIVGTNLITSGTVAADKMVVPTSDATIGVYFYDK